MNRLQRRPWLELLRSRDEFGAPTLCGWCRYYEFWDDEATCRHPIEVVSDHNVLDAETGADCWAFRPRRGLTPTQAARGCGEEMIGGDRSGEILG